MNESTTAVKFKQYLDWMNSLHFELIKFEKDTNLFGSGFKPYRKNLNIENGTYLTLRCGLSGIYSCVDEMVNNEWSTKVLDNSFVIAYRPLKESEKFIS